MNERSEVQKLNEAIKRVASRMGNLTKKMLKLFRSGVSRDSAEYQDLRKKYNELEEQMKELKSFKIKKGSNPMKKLMKNKTFLMLALVAGAGAVYWYMKKSKEAKSLQAIKDLNQTQSAGTINFNTMTA